MAQYVFGPFFLHLEDRKFQHGSEEIRLRGKVFDTLSFFVQNPGRLIRKDEFLRNIWPDTVVEENNLDYCVSQLRKAFGAHREFIQTVPRQGFRFTAPVNVASPRLQLVNVIPSPQGEEVPPQEVRYFTTSDGVRIAYTVGGSGSPLIRAVDWLNHLDFLDFEWKNPFHRQWLSQVMHRHTLVRYDQRGSGLSDWNISDFSFGRSISDFSELVDKLGFPTFTLMGSCQGGAIAAAYAALNPDRVDKLILVGSFASGWPSPGEMSEEHFEAMLTLIELGWGRDNPAFRQLWTSLFKPDATPAEMDWMNELQRISSSPQNAVRMMKEFPNFNILDMLPKVSCPTLVLHSRDDATVPVREGRLIASRIRGARFVELPSRSHQVGPGESAWRDFVAEVGGFLGWDTSAAEN